MRIILHWSDPEILLKEWVGYGEMRDQENWGNSVGKKEC